MTLSGEITHTDAGEQTRFALLTTDQKLLEIFLNGRETNGHVADVMERTAALERFREAELKPWMQGVDRKMIAWGAIVAAILFLAPFVFAVLLKYLG